MLFYVMYIKFSYNKMNFHPVILTQILIQLPICESIHHTV